MKRLIVANAHGEILATGPHPDDSPQTAGKKSQFGFIALKGQYLHEVELPAHVKTTEQLLELHRTHIVRKEGDKVLLHAK